MGLQAVMAMSWGVGTFCTLLLMVGLFLWNGERQAIRAKQTEADRLKERRAQQRREALLQRRLMRASARLEQFTDSFIQRHSASLGD